MPATYPRRVHRIRLDPALPLRSQPQRGHNRWTPELEPVLTVEEGDEVELELRDAMDAQIGPDSADDDLLTMQPISHVLTGPVAVAEAEPGDVLDVEIVGYETAGFGWTGVVPGAGIVGDLVERPLLVKWALEGGVARSEQLPGITVRASTHAGVMGVAPSRELFDAALARETALHDAGHAIRMPDPATAFPIDGLRTMPPRENGGNMDVRDLVAGARLLLPVHVPGALFSAGDLHFVQGDGEVSLYAIECAGAIRVRLRLRRQPSWLPRFPAYEAPARPERRVFATTGIPLRDDGSNGYLDSQLAARRAIVELIGWLRAHRGMTTEQAIALCSVAAELRMSQVVDFPNALVSAALPLDVFDD
jgi:formamidase